MEAYGALKGDNLCEQLTATHGAVGMSNSHPGKSHLMKMFQSSGST